VPEFDRLVRSLLLVMTIHRFEVQRHTGASYDDLLERTLALLRDLRSRASGFSDRANEVRDQIDDAIHEVEGGLR
jgi:hypothetical protein